MKSLIISCRTIKAEVDMAIGQTGCNYPVLFLDSALHVEPEKLKIALQQELERVSNVDQVLLVMGFCGNAITDLKPEGFRLVVPRADDCITMLLGSQKRRKEVGEDMPTYFLTKGWLGVEKHIFDEHERTIRKYGKEQAERILRIMFKNYKRLGLIDTGAFDLESMMGTTERIASLLNLTHEILPGTMSYIEKFLTGPWDDDFIIINSGETITCDHLFGSKQAAEEPAERAAENYAN